MRRTVTTRTTLAARRGKLEEARFARPSPTSTKGARVTGGINSTNSAVTCAHTSRQRMALTLTPSVFHGRLILSEHADGTRHPCGRTEEAWAEDQDSVIVEKPAATLFSALFYS